MLTGATLDSNTKKMYVLVFWSPAEKIPHLKWAHSAGRSTCPHLTCLWGLISHLSGDWHGHRFPAPRGEPVFKVIPCSCCLCFWGRCGDIIAQNAPPEIVLAFLDASQQLKERLLHVLLNVAWLSRVISSSILPQSSTFPDSPGILLSHPVWCLSLRQNH